MRNLVVLAGVLAALVLPAAARADSGAITAVAPLDDGSVTANGSSISITCTGDGFCGWYPHARQVPATQPCGPWQVDELTYVGDYRDDPGTQTGSDSFVPIADSVRICLYISDPDDLEPLVAEYVYPAPGGNAPSPAPSPQPVSPTVPKLGVAAARARVAAALRDEHPRAFHGRHRFTRSCARVRSHRVRCRVRWAKGAFRYTGSVTLRNDRDDPPRIVWSTSIHRKRIR